MRTAILLTGQERQFNRVIGLLRKNLLENNNCTIFLACETNNTLKFLEYFKGLEVGGIDIRSTFQTDEYKSILQTIKCSDRPALTEDVFARSRAADNLNWQYGYVENGGTILQYYQLWKAWMLLLEYETKHSMRFDTCVRLRPDSILSKPIQLDHFFQHPPRDNEIEMRSLGSAYMKNILTNEPPRIKDIYEHPFGTLYTDRIVWTLGHEQCWIASRDTFEVFGPMLMYFGCWDSGKPFAFNSETFFHQFCIQHGIVHWIFLEHDNPLFNCFHPGTDQITEDPWLFSLLR